MFIKYEGKKLSMKYDIEKLLSMKYDWDPPIGTLAYGKLDHCPLYPDLSAV